MALIDFIIKAKISGYASGGEGQERKFDDGSLRFELMADGYRYLERYYGFNPFAGTEYIYDVNDSLIWIMNYYGEALPAHSDPKKIYSFLREAMSSITPAYPFRGSGKLEKDNLQYENIQNGTLDSFHGVESIILSTNIAVFMVILPAYWGFYHQAKASDSIHLKNVPYVVQKERLD
ncbi:MAG: DUF5680 domain-containing protein [Thermodesulfobacteriota bacterium]|nr:DUF5680 domain-containing protein [Thermodesulfobacteriota bacterium]